MPAVLTGEGLRVMDGRFDFAPALPVQLSRADRRARERMFAKAMVKEAGVTRRQAIEQVRATTRDLEQDALFKSSLYQVMVRDRDGLHVTVKRLDREPIFERDDLVEIGRQFTPEDAIAVELYPAESRVVDTANQYHIFCVPSVIKSESGDASLALHDVVRQTAAKEDGRNAGDDWSMWVLREGERRDWRDLMNRKRGWIGAESEAIDLLVPESVGRGPCWFAVTKPGFRMPFGFASGARSDRETWNTRQRPGSSMR